MDRSQIEALLARIDIWLLVFGIIVVAGVAGESIFGIRHWWNSRKLEAIQRQDELNLQADIARARTIAATAEENAANARERAASAETRAAEASRKADEERIARLKIEALLAPRRISSEQEKVMKGELAKVRNPNLIFFVVIGSPETADFAADLERVFKSAGLSVTVRHGIMFGGIGRGLSANAGQNRLGDVNSIALALLAAKLITGPLPIERNPNGPDTLELRIAPK